MQNKLNAGTQTEFLSSNFSLSFNSYKMKFKLRSLIAPTFHVILAIIALVLVVLA